MPRHPRISPASVDAVVRSVRRGQRQLAREPRRAIEGAVRQLLSLRGTPAEASDEGDRTYRIDDLAQATGVTVRNIRAYQSRRLLHPPVRRGRIVLFDESHVARLRIITSMLDRGYTAAHILEMLSAWESGKDLGHVLGLEEALLPSGSYDAPRTVDRATAVGLAGGEDELLACIEAGLAEPGDQDRVRVLRPGLLEAFGELREFGVGFERALRLHLEVLPHLEAITTLLVEAGVEQVGPQLQPTNEPSSDEVARLIEMLHRFRGLAMTNVTASLASTLDDRIEGLLAEYLAWLASDGDATSEAG